MDHLRLLLDPEEVLNRLPNEMDGLREDADILFVLTTNRPEAIEEALAQRPGRIDEAIEIANPDAECRRRLVQLYGRELVLRDGALDALVEGSDGASAAFVKEMVRRAAQVAISAGRDKHVDRDDALAVLQLSADGGRVTRFIIGFDRSSARAGRHALPFDDCDRDRCG